MDKLQITERRAFKSYDRLVKYAIDLLGRNINMKEFINAENPSQFIVEQFAKDALDEIPKHFAEQYYNKANDRYAGSSYMQKRYGGTSLTGIAETHRLFKAYCFSLGEDNAPVIVDNKLVSRLE